MIRKIKERGAGSQSLRLAGFELELTRKPIRRLNLRVPSAEGPLQVSMPFSMPFTVLESFLIVKRGWIEKARARIAARDTAEHPACPSYAEGEAVPLWGRPLRLHWGEGREGIRDDTLCLRRSLDETPAAREQRLYQFYRKELQKELQERVPSAAEKLGLPIPRIEIRRMTSLWGSCRLKSRSVCFNLELVRFPREILDYLVLHELMHFIEPSHNARYHRLMDAAMPDWKARRACLKRPFPA